MIGVAEVRKLYTGFPDKLLRRNYKRMLQVKSTPNYKYYSDWPNNRGCTFEEELSICVSELLLRGMGL